MLEFELKNNTPLYGRIIPCFRQFDIIDGNNQMGFVCFDILHTIFDNLRKDKK